VEGLQRGFQQRPAGAYQVVAGGARDHGVVGLARGGQHGLGDGALGFAGLLRQPFHGARDLLARELAFARKTRQPAQHLQRVAHGLYQLHPFNLADEPQRGDDVADREVGGHLHGLAFADHAQRVGAVLRGPAHQRQGGRRVGLGAGRHALPELGQVAALQAVDLHQGQQLVEFAQAQRLGLVPGGVGDFARDLVPGDAVGHAAQVFQQHHAQGGGQRPEFAEVELADLLVGMQESREQDGVEHAVGVGHIGPGDAVDARQPLQRPVGQLGQVGVVAVRHAVLDLLQLRLDQVEVVEQPFGRGRDVVAAERG
jgi:hypothetical protein